MTHRDPTRPARLTQTSAAALISSVTGVGLRQAREALRAGLAGEPVKAGRALTFDRAAVERVADRMRLTCRILNHRCPGGVTVINEVVHPHRSPVARLTRPMALQPIACGVNWSTFAPHVVCPPEPFIGTVGGFVSVVAEVVSRTCGGRHGVWHLQPPTSDWWVGLEDLALRIPGGTRVHRHGLLWCWGWDGPGTAFRQDPCRVLESPMGWENRLP